MNEWIFDSCAFFCAFFPFCLFLYVKFQCVSFVLSYFIIIPYNSVCISMKDRKVVTLYGREGGDKLEVE